MAAVPISTEAEMLEMTAFFGEIHFVHFSNIKSISCAGRYGSASSPVRFNEFPVRRSAVSAAPELLR
jgi:hypothetical protein